MNISQFRQAFPEFADSCKYSTTQITFWATIAEQQTVENVWKDMWTFGVQLYVAHEITMANQNAKTATAGGTPGTFGGIANNKSVGQASIGFDSASNSEKDAGWWNLTNYGKQYIRLARMFGAGCVQL